MKKRFLPKAWIWQKYFSKDKEENKAFMEVFVRFGRWMASDFVGEVKDDIHILPCLSFYFNHSELFVLFGWLNFECWMRYENWKRADAYMKKLRRKQINEGDWV